MIAKAILQERGNIQAEISSQIQKAIDHHVENRLPHLGYVLQTTLISTVEIIKNSNVVKQGFNQTFQSFAFLMAADKGKRKRPDCESDEISVSRPFKLVSCKTNRGDEENSTDHTKGGYFEEEYDQEGWFIGYRYRGDKAGYVCREDTDDEVDEEVSSGRLAQYGDGDGENSSEHEGANYEEEYCAEGWFIGYKYKESSILQTKRKKSQKDDSDDDKTVKKPKGGDGFLVKNDKDVNLVKKERKRDEVEAEYEERKYGGVDVDKGEDEGVKVKIGEKRKGKGDEQLLVAKEGFDDEEKLLRTVFVGNLPLKVKKKALLREFAKFGEVESVQIRSIPLLDDKTPRKGAIIKKQINDAVDSFLVLPPGADLCLRFGGRCPPWLDQKAEIIV
ncbi:RNA-binding protein 34 [Tanacetum coccineum]